MDIGHLLFIVDWVIVGVGAFGAAGALITMVRHQHH